MAINQAGLNQILSAFEHKSNLDAMRQKRQDLLNKLNQNDPDNKNVDRKQVVHDLAAADKEIGQEVYNETSRKLELERIKNEEAAAKKQREKEKLLGKHEHILQTASMNHLFSAMSSISDLKTMVGSGMKISLSDGVNTGNKLIEKAKDINRDLKESVEYGKAAAEVARRRERGELKENSKHHKKRKSINIKV